MLCGGCFCGEIRYVTEAQASNETVCHCIDCRRTVGATAIAWFTVPRTSLVISAGRPKTFQSSADVVRSFCGTCGTSLFYAHRASSDEVDITTASLDDPDAVPPKDHVHTARRPAWVSLCDGLPAFPGRRGGG